MNYKVKLLPEANLDILEIIKWYNGERPGLGKQFYKSLKLKIDYIKKYPLHYQPSYRDVRNVFMNKFPYQVHYRIEESIRSVIVLGVTHTSRYPRIWKNRR